MIALGCDHAGLELKNIIKDHLDMRKIEYKDFGTYTPESTDYAVYAELAAKAVASGECSLGLLFCGTGVGISMAANKVRGIRAACCSDAFSAEMTRLHNDANMLLPRRQSGHSRESYRACRYLPRYAVQRRGAPRSQDRSDN